MSIEGRRTARRVFRGLPTAPNRRGIASIEFGIVMTAIVVVVLGTYDIGNYVLQQMKLADVAHVGGQFAVSYPLDTTGATTVMDAALPPAWVNDVTITGPSITCACANGGAEADCSASPICPLGDSTERFITVTVQRAYSALLVPGLTSTSATYVVRVQ